MEALEQPETNVTSNALVNINATNSSLAVAVAKEEQNTHLANDTISSKDDLLNSPKNNGTAGDEPESLQSNDKTETNQSEAASPVVVNDINNGCKDTSLVEPATACDEDDDEEEGEENEEENLKHTPAINTSSSAQAPPATIVDDAVGEEDDGMSVGTAQTTSGSVTPKEAVEKTPEHSNASGSSRKSQSDAEEDGGESVAGDSSDDDSFASAPNTPEAEAAAGLDEDTNVCSDIVATKTSDNSLHKTPTVEYAKENEVSIALASLDGAAAASVAAGVAAVAAAVAAIAAAAEPQYENPKVNGEHKSNCVDIEGMDKSPSAVLLKTTELTSVEAPAVETLLTESASENNLNSTLTDNFKPELSPLVENAQHSTENEASSAGTLNENYGAGEGEDSSCSYTSKKKNNALTGNATPALDESSQSSMSTVLSAASLSTTSSQQLVIDHPMDDGENGKLLAPLKMSVKHKLSLSLEEEFKQAEQFILNEISNMSEKNATADNLVRETNEDSSSFVSQPQSSSLLMARLSQPLEATVALATATASKVYAQQPMEFKCCHCSAASFDAQYLLNEHYAVCVALKPPTPVDKDCNMNMRHDEAEQPPKKKRYYRCLPCQSVHEECSFFNHVREQHKRFMCFYCVRLFPTAEKLSLHMENKHDLEQNHFNSERAWRDKKISDKGECSLTCCTCQHVFQANESFLEHNCGEFLQPCALCGQRGRHTNRCKNNNSIKRTTANLKRKMKRKPPQPVSLQRAPHMAAALALPVAEPAVAVPEAMPAAPIFAAQHQIAGAQMHCVESESRSCSAIDGTCNNSGSQEQMDVSGGDEAIAEAESEPEPETNGLVELEPPIPKLVIPKIMLRVPKEFQKSVDAEVSSSDSEDFDDEEQLECYSTTKSVEDAAPPVGGGERQVSHLCDMDTNSATETATEASIVNESNSGGPSVEAADAQNTDEDSGDSTNKNLSRILDEIERTKLEIRRTKDEVLHKQEVTPTSRGRMNNAPPAAGSAEQQRWSPTPPASPHSRWFTPRRAISQLPQSDDAVAATLDNRATTAEAQDSEPEAELQAAQLARRDTVGSDAMDIDNTICNSTASTQSFVEPATTMQERFEHSTVDLSASIVMPKDEEGPLAASDAARKTEDGTSDLSNDIEDADTDKLNASEDMLDVETPDTSDGIEVAGDEVAAVELLLERPLDKIEFVDFLRLCLKAVYPLCLYCNHARRIAVNAKSLVLHMIAHHRFTATVDSITAEELQAETIVARLKSFLPDNETEYLNSSSYCTLGEGAYTRPFNERIYECFQCRFVTSTHKELYMHNRRLHIKTAILCFMCRSNFYSFSEILCHICPGEANKTSIFDVKYRCCLCEVTNLPSPFRLMVHLRKKHFACDVCLEDCRDQSKLSSHVWKHKLHHLCYRCGIAYRNKQDITKHLYWKHGTESIKCKRCLQKRWRHVYHFCVPPPSFVCEECNLCFSRAMYLEVHKRTHTGDFRYPCTEEQCEEKFVSRRLLLRHTAKHQPDAPTAEQVKHAEQLALAGATDSDDKKATQLQLAELKTELQYSEGHVNDEKSNLNAITDEDKVTENAAEPSTSAEETPRKKRKKNKRAKPSLDDLNLIAPNLSESDSSDDSETENKPKVDDHVLQLPKVMLSPSSESEHEHSSAEQKPTEDAAATADADADPAAAAAAGVDDKDQMPDIWKNLLRATNNVPIPDANLLPVNTTQANYTEQNQPQPKALHVCVSDHDYCRMHRPATPPPPPATAESKAAAKAAARKTGKRNNDDFSSDSSSESSSSSGSSSCSCGSNCSCSSSDSGSTSSSSSSDDSDSSAASKSSRKKQKKKSARSKSVSPLKQSHKNNSSGNINNNNNSSLAGQSAKLDDDQDELINVTATDEQKDASPQKPPPFYETDFETAESETDEEFYDEHPQKLANELLAQKRAALMAQTRLSPSHNYDIVENSRPSTPSLPEEVATYDEKRSKPKKKKRDRKSTSRANQKLQLSQEQTTPLSSTAAALHYAPQATHMETAQMFNYDANATLPVMPTTTSTPYGATQQQLQAAGFYGNATMLQNSVEQLSTPRFLGHLAHMPTKHHMSEGSSCSDADASLKRSKRARRPNRFYGYSSDDEHMSSVLAPPLLVGMQLIKPQPPPQLTWAKEDLPTPSKSILNNKSKSSRHAKMPSAPFSEDMSHSSGTSSRKRSKRAPGSIEKPQRKRANKTKEATDAYAESLPPIPTLKIRPSQLLAASTNDSDESSDSSSDEEIDVQAMNEPHTVNNSWNVASNAQAATPHLRLPTIPLSHAANFYQAVALPPVPEVTVFKQKIPPALLPNPDFATLQYFKANNIRYPIRPPAGARLAREGEAVYCYCRCPYDEVSEMIACDGENCLIEWFHFECVGIIMAPQGKWFCAECRPKYSEELYPTTRN